MSDLNRVLNESLHGDETHIDTLKGLSELSDSEAKEKPIISSHSSFEILFHMIYWQDLLIEGLSDRKFFKKKLVNSNWPSEGDYLHLTWQDLLEQFTKGIEIAKEIIANIDLTKPIKIAGNNPALKPILVILQHNSYHLGQISQVRKSQGTWNFSD